MTDPTYTCPEGHESTAADYCDTCGAPIGGAGSGATPPAAATAAPAPAASTATKPCPSCDEPNAADSLFCEDCGYDFTTGQMPAPSAAVPPTGGSPGAAPSSLSIDGPAPVTWVAELWVDAAWYEANRESATDPCPSAGMPRVVGLVGTGPHLVGRPSQSRGIAPQLDCTPDTGVSRRHAQLLLDQDRWYLEDLGSTNGSFVGAGAGPVPDVPIPPGQRREVGDGDRIYVGTWTRIVIRRATAGEAST